MKQELETREIINRFSDTIHDDPVIADSSVSPNVGLNLVTGVLGGLLVSLFLALPVMWLLNRKHAA